MNTNMRKVIIIKSQFYSQYSTLKDKNSDEIASDSLTSFYIFIIKFAAETFLVFRHSHYVRAIIIFISDPNSNSQSARMYKYHHTDEHVSIIMRRHDRDLFGIPSCSRFPDRNNAMRTL